MSRACCKTFAFVFLGIIFAVPLFQGVWEKVVEGESLRVLGVFRKVPSEANLRSFEKELEESCKVADWLRPAYRQLRWLLMRDLGDKAVAAADGWAFYGPDIRYLGEGYFKNLKSEGPGEDPAATIADFAGQLRRHGIALLVVPVPSKPSIAPERLRRGLAPSLDLSVNTRRFMDELRGQGIDVLDLFTPLVREQRNRPDRPRLYLAADTHWTGEGARLAATLLAERVRAVVGADQLLPRVNYRRETVTVSRRPDIPRMSRLPGESRAFPPETTTAYRVLDEAGEPYADSDESRILLLGDSFSRIYQTDEPEAAGLIANLAYELHTPLASIVNDGGASTLVRQELARNLEILQGKRIVIWAFAERDLRFGMKGWAKIALDE
ncbi:MAG: hypothetical protein WCG85_10630 [Polyangia bacterium]